MDTKEVVARFEAERQALALMDHPHIAKVLDGGATTSGRPFFVMELVKGVPITEYCDRAKLGVRERLGLFVSVCDALQHAHHKGIIHRDVKPTNVMVTLHDGVPVPKVIDFGIAKATHAELTQKTLFTQYERMVGTPEYMAPEQAEMSGLDVDTRADVYSLGVLLYELLTGTKPFELKEVLQKGYLELLRTIREDEPARPSTRVSSLGEEATPIAAARHVDPRVLRKRLSGELDWIVMRALEKDRARRYETANSFAADIQRYLRAERERAGELADRSARASAAIEEASLALGRAIAAPVSRESEWVAASLLRERVLGMESEGPVHEDVAARATAFRAQFDEASTGRDLALRLENVLITSATHPDLASWTRMEEELRELFLEQGMDLAREDPLQVAARIREHRFVDLLRDMLELWIATRGHLAALGGPRVTAADMQPWAEAIFAADDDPLRTGIRRLIYSGVPPSREQVDALVQDADLASLAPRTLAWLASTYAMARAPKEADRVLRNAVRNHPQDVMLSFDHGFMLAAQQRWQEASRQYTRALTIRPDAAGIWRMLGAALEEAGEFDNALDAYRNACAYESEYAMNWMQLAELLLARERHAETLAAGRTLIELDAEDPAGHGFAGRALLALERPAEALPVLETCARLAALTPAWDEPVDTWLADCRARLGED